MRERERGRTSTLQLKVSPSSKLVTSSPVNSIDLGREREREREGERQGEKGESGRNPPLGVSIKRSIVSDRESSRGRFNGA